MTAALIQMQVVYALPERQTLLNVEVRAGTTVAEVVRRSGMLERHPEIDLASDRVGLWGKLCSSDDVVREGGRIEIYRPLKADPKAARRQRARRAR